MIVAVYCFGAGFVTGVGVGAFQYAVFMLHLDKEAKRDR